MADDKFLQGPGGRLQRAQADATKVNRDQRSKGPYIVMYDKVDYTNPFEWKLGVVKGLKKANTMLGGDIERTGYDRESYGDVINRLEQTPGTIQHAIKKVSVPNIPSPFAGPANLAINAFNYVRPGANRAAAAVGEEALDPLNWAPAGRFAKFGFKLASQIANLPSGAAKALKFIGNAAPWIESGKDASDVANEYIDYTKKPKFYQEKKEMTPQQKEFLQKLSKYNF